VTGPSVLDLFAGIGGLSLGLERAGFTIAGQVEIDPWCRSILSEHWPEVPRHDDVRTAPAWWAARPAPNVVAGGFPCQPVSDAGRRLAQADPRWLWPAMADVIAATGPAWVVIENVPGLRSRGLADVLSDLARFGYRARPGLISACEMGAPHPRKRLFTLAHAQSLRCGQRRPGRPDRDDPPRPPLGPPPLADPSGYGASPRDVTHGPANPDWIEWLMGFPIGWTAPAGSATPSCPPSPSTSAR